MYRSTPASSRPCWPSSSSRRCRHTSLGLEDVGAKEGVSAKLTLLRVSADEDAHVVFTVSIYVVVLEKKRSPSWCKASGLEYWWPPSPSWPNYGRWWVEEGGAVSGVDHDAREPTKCPMMPRYAGVRQGAKFSWHHFDALVGWTKPEGKIEYGTWYTYKITTLSYIKLHANEIFMWNYKITKISYIKLHLNCPIKLHDNENKSEGQIIKIMLWHVLSRELEHKCNSGTREGERVSWRSSAPVPS
jgi:hypothetical protein